MRVFYKAASWAKRHAKRILGPKVLRAKTPCATMPPRTGVCEHDDTVFSFAGQDNEIFEQMNAKKEELFKGFQPHHRVFIKINLNTALPYPASTDPRMLSAILDMMMSLGIRDIVVGDCSSNIALPTRKAFQRSGISAAIKQKAEMACFDEQPWVSVPIGGQYLKQVTLPEIICKVDRVIYLANLKTHVHADFSASMKLAVGFMHPLERYDLHKEFLKEKIAEIALAVQPDLIFLDARMPFITGGPNEGSTARGGMLFAGTDLLSIDLQGYRLLLKLKEIMNCLEGFRQDPFEMIQLQHAAKILGRKQTP